MRRRKHRYPLGGASAIANDKTTTIGPNGKLAKFPFAIQDLSFDHPFIQSFGDPIDVSASLYPLLN